MKKAKITLCIILSIVAILLPFVAVTVFAIALPPQYSDTFVGELNEKYDRLNSIEEPKIVIVGGSSVAFGIDSEKLEEYTGMPVVNFGLYAALGTKVMIDLAESGIKDGDIVIFSPEMDPQTMSLYFNSETTLKALDDKFSMFRHIDVNNWFNLLGGMWKFAGDKYERFQKSKKGELKPLPDTVIYQQKFFDEYGDFDYPRENNRMDGYYDVNTPINLDKSKVSDDFDEFVKYVNKFIKKMEKRGATVYYSYCPMNELAITKNSTEENKQEFCEFLEDSFNCDFISDIDSCIMEPGYFFDTNFHLNDAGVKVRTIRLAKDIRLAHGITAGIIKDEEPEAPALPGADLIFDGVDENAKYFELEQLENGAYAIVGLSEEGKKQKDLTIPLGYEGMKVTTVKPEAFKGGVLEILRLPEDVNLTKFENDAFRGAGTLKEMYIYFNSGDKVMPPDRFTGVHSDFKVHVPEVSDFTIHYYWSERELTFVEDIK